MSELVKELGIQVPMPMEVHCDNKSAIHIAENPVFHERTKHIEIDCHVTRDRIKSGMIVLKHIGTNDQPADLFTKALHRTRLQQLLSKLGVHDIYSPTCGRVSNAVRSSVVMKNKRRNEEQMEKKTETVSQRQDTKGIGA